MIENLTILQFMTSIFTFSGLLIINIVKLWGKTDLEIQTTTNHQRFINAGSVVFVFSILFTIVLIVAFDDIFKIRNGEQVAHDPFIEVISTFIIIFFITTVAFISTQLIEMFFNVIPKFKVVLEDKEGEWYLYRMINKNEMLVVENKHHYAIVTNWKQAHFIREGYHKSLVVEFIYGKTRPKLRRVCQFLFGMVFILSIIVIIFKWVNKDNPYWFFFFSVYIILYIASAFYYFDNRKRYNHYQVMK